MMTPLAFCWNIKLFLSKLTLQLNFHILSLNLDILGVILSWRLSVLKTFLNVLIAIFKRNHRLKNFQIRKQLFFLKVFHQENSTCVSTGILVLKALHLNNFKGVLSALKKLCDINYCIIDSSLVIWRLFELKSLLKATSRAFLIDCNMTELRIIISQQAITIIHANTSDLN